MLPLSTKKLKFQGCVNYTEIFLKDLVKDLNALVFRLEADLVKRLKLLESSGTCSVIIMNQFVAAVASENPVLERPMFGCQVIVQSEEEKNLRKAMRKEEKRLNKLLNKADGVNEN